MDVPGRFLPQLSPAASPPGFVVPRSAPARSPRPSPGTAPAGPAIPTRTPPGPGPRIVDTRATSLRPVAARDPRIGYHPAMEIAKRALAADGMLKDAAARRGPVAPGTLDRRARPGAA